MNDLPLPCLSTEGSPKSFETPVFVWRHRVQSHQKLPRSDEAPHENGCCYCASRRDPSVGPSCGCRFPGTQAVRVWRICRTGRISSNNQKAGWDSPHRPTDLVGQIHRTPQNSPMVNSMVFWLVVSTLPLWKMMEFVSWDHDIPNWMEKQKSCSKPPTSFCFSPLFFAKKSFP